VPIFKNFSGDTPFHTVIKSNNNKCLQIILTSVMGCSVDHHDRLIYDIMNNIVESGIEVVGEYLDSRMQSLKYLSIPRLKRGKLIDDEENCQYSIQKLWEDTAILADAFFAGDDEEVEEQDVTNKVVCFSGLFNN
jgi:hypothetical protein